MDDSDFGKGIFSDDDEIPVDMEMLKEKINLVPLSDMDFGEAPDDLMDLDCSIQDHLLTPLTLESSGDFKDSLKLDTELSQIKTNEEETALKQVKTEACDPGLDVGGTTATAAKLAEEVSADIVTGGIVAESEPPPDFSCWTVEDDILLKNAMEVGAAVEALAKGAVKFSRRYTVQELRARWRALLYDPVISQEAALRMMKSDACLPNPTKLTNLNRLKYPQVSNKKRKLKSVRASYYKMRKNLAAELSTNSSVVKVEADTVESLPGKIASKDSDLCVEENMFTQMFELFASGGVGEVVQAVPSGQVDLAQKECLVANPEHKGETGKPDVHSQEHMVNIDESNSSINCQLSPDASKASIGSGTVGNLKQEGDDQKNDLSTIEPNISTAQKLTPIVSGKDDVDAAEGMELQRREGKANCALDLSNKTECTDISNVENMTCVLNTEDTDIPSPPPGSALRVPSLFSNMYFASEIRSEKSELGRMRAGYGKGDDFVTSRKLPSITEDKNNTGGVVKLEPCSDVLAATTAQGALPSSSANADVVPQRHVVDNPISQSGVAAGSINESSFPSEAGVGPLEQEFRYIDKTMGSLTTMKGGALYQDHSDGLESEDELPNFSDVEAMILDMDLDPVFDEDALARAESRRLYRRHRKTLMRLEQGANAALDRALTLKGAIAVFYGYYLRYFITKNEVTLGRMTSDNVVDIDLGKEGRANKVSRKQATIKLKKDGVFYLKNFGRRDLSVNNIPIPYGQHAHLGSNCLIEVGGMRFVFEINKKLVKQHVAEMLNSQQQQQLQAATAAITPTAAITAATTTACRDQ